MLVTVRDGGAIGAAALGCYWGCCFRVLVMDGRVLRRVLFGVSWLSHHHDAGRSIMMLSAAS